MNGKRLTKSIRDAVLGVAYIFRHEQNFRIQCGAGMLALALGAGFHVSRGEWIVLLLLIFLVLLLEIVNSAVESMLDIMRPRLHAQVKVVKDMMAGAVFFAAFGALAIGAIIFWPHVVSLLFS